MLPHFQNLYHISYLHSRSSCLDFVKKVSRVVVSLFVSALLELCPLLLGLCTMVTKQDKKSHLYKLIKSYYIYYTEMRRLPSFIHLYKTGKNLYQLLTCSFSSSFHMWLTFGFDYVRFNLMGRTISKSEADIVIYLYLNRE